MKTSAIIGCGTRGPGHARSYALLDQVKLVACCDIDRAAVQAFAQRFGIPEGFTSIANMLQAVQPDLVHIVTPPATHVSIVEQVVQHRPRAILLEKPLSIIPEDAYRILDACAAAGVPLFVNHQLRYLAPFMHFRACLQSYDLGALRAVRATTQSSLLEQGTHLFDLIHFFMGDDAVFHEVLAQATGVVEPPQHTAGSPEYTCGVIRSTGDLHIYFECGPKAPAKPGDPNPWHQFGIDLLFDQGFAGMSLNRGWWCAAGALRQAEHYSHNDDDDDRAQARLVSTLLNALDSPDQHPCGPHSAQTIFDVTVAIQKSALHGCWITVGEQASNAEVAQLHARLAEAASVNV